LTYEERVGVKPVSNVAYCHHERVKMEINANLILYTMVLSEDSARRKN
jgi:hypothetical protein